MFLWFQEIVPWTQFFRKRPEGVFLASRPLAVTRVCASRPMAVTCVSASSPLDVTRVLRFLVAARRCVSTTVCLVVACGRCGLHAIRFHFPFSADVAVRAVEFFACRLRARGLLRWSSLVGVTCEVSRFAPRMVAWFQWCESVLQSPVLGLHSQRAGGVRGAPGAR